MYYIIIKNKNILKMVLPINLKFLIINYLNTNTLIKLCQITKVCQNSCFWRPLVNEIKYLKNRASDITKKLIYLIQLL